MILGDLGVFVDALEFVVERELILEKDVGAGETRRRFVHVPA